MCRRMRTSNLASSSYILSLYLREKGLSLVTFLNLALIYSNIPFNAQCTDYIIAYMCILDPSYNAIKHVEIHTAQRMSMQSTVCLPLQHLSFIYTASL